MSEQRRKRKYFRTGGYSRGFTPRGAGKKYLLDRIPAGLWTAVQQKAKAEAVSIRALILGLLLRWVDGEVQTPRDKP